MASFRQHHHLQSRHNHSSRQTSHNDNHPSKERGQTRTTTGHHLHQSCLNSSNNNRSGKSPVSTPCLQRVSRQQHDRLLARLILAATIAPSHSNAHSITTNGQTVATELPKSNLLRFWGVTGAYYGHYQQMAMGNQQPTPTTPMLNGLPTVPHLDTCLS